MGFDPRPPLRSTIATHLVDAHQFDEESARDLARDLDRVIGRWIRESGLTLEKIEPTTPPPGTPVVVTPSGQIAELFSRVFALERYLHLEPVIPPKSPDPSMFDCSFRSYDAQGKPIPSPSSSVKCGRFLDVSVRCCLPPQHLGPCSR